MVSLLAAAFLVAAPDPPTPLSEVVTQPPSGAMGVPTNAVLILEGNDTHPQVTVDGAGATSTAMSDPYRLHDRYLLGDLEPTTAYELTLDDNETDVAVVQLETGAGPDTTAPETISGLTTEQIDHELPGYQAVVLTIPLPEDDSGIAGLVLELANDDEEPFESPRVLSDHTAAAFEERFNFFFENPDEQQTTRVRVLAFDWAGNEGSFSEPIEIVVDAPETAGGGCRCVTGSAAAPLSVWALLLMLPVVRRRRA